MLALLGLLAVAGYQNRDKIANALGNLQNRTGANPPGGPNVGTGGLGSILSGFGAGGVVGGLGDLLDSFKSAGHADVANSWVDPTVPTQGLRPEQVEQAVGSENLAELAHRTGLSQQELIERLATVIPGAVDTLTPDGKIPTEAEIRQRLPSAA